MERREPRKPSRQGRPASGSALSSTAVRIQVSHVQVAALLKILLGSPSGWSPSPGALPWNPTTPSLLQL